MLSYVIVGIVIGIVVSRLMARQPGGSKEFPKGQGSGAKAQAAAQGTVQTSTPGLPTLAEITSVARAGNKIQAIKLYRELYGVGLKEAKEAVEALVD